MPRNLLLPCFGALAAHVKWRVASKVASEVWSKVGRSGTGEKPISALGKCRNRKVCMWCECLLAEKQRKMRAKHTAESLFFEKQSFQPCVSLSFFVFLPTSTRVLAFFSAIFLCEKHAACGEWWLEENRLPARARLEENRLSASVFRVRGNCFTGEIAASARYLKP